MSLPPALWTETGLQGPVRSRSRLPGFLWDFALAATWAARNPEARERFRSEPQSCRLTGIYYQTVDGWESPLWRLPPRPDATGEPIILAPGLGLNARSLDLEPSRSLIRFLHDEGYDVFVLSHRGDRDSRAPSGSASFDFDDIVFQDVPAAIAKVKELTHADRVLWLGHALGGLLLYGHLAADGADDIAAAVSLGAPVQFQTPRASAKRIARIAQMIPAEWRIPVRLLQEVAVAASRPEHLTPISQRIEGPLVRSLLMDGTEDIGIGLIRQMSRWFEVGHLCDRHNRFDYLAALNGRKTPVFGIASTDDPICTPQMARPAIDALDSGCTDWWVLDSGWSHLDLLAGADASRVVFPRVATWLARWRAQCWSRP